MTPRSVAGRLKARRDKLNAPHASFAGELESDAKSKDKEAHGKRDELAGNSGGNCQDEF